MWATSSSWPWQLPTAHLTMATRAVLDRISQILCDYKQYDRITEKHTQTNKQTDIQTDSHTEQTRDFSLEYVQDQFIIMGSISKHCSSNTTSQG